MPLQFRKFWISHSSGSGFKVVVSQNTFGIADMSEDQFVNIYDDFQSQPRLIMEQVTEHSELSVSSRPPAPELGLFPPSTVRPSAIHCPHYRCSLPPSLSSAAAAMVVAKKKVAKSESPSPVAHAYYGNTQRTVS